MAQIIGSGISLPVRTVARDKSFIVGLDLSFGRYCYTICCLRKWGTRICLLIRVIIYHRGVLHDVLFSFVHDRCVNSHFPASKRAEKIIVTASRWSRSCMKNETRIFKKI